MTLLNKISERVKYNLQAPAQNSEWLCQINSRLFYITEYVDIVSCLGVIRKDLINKMTFDRWMFVRTRHSTYTVFQYDNRPNIIMKMYFMENITSHITQNTNGQCISPARVLSNVSKVQNTTTFKIGLFSCTNCILN